MMQSHPQSSDIGITICGTTDLSGTQEKGDCRPPMFISSSMLLTLTGKGGMCILRPFEQHRQLVQTFQLTSDHMLPFDPAVSTSLCCKCPFRNRGWKLREVG